jgi:hypothetical protein
MNDTTKEPVLYANQDELFEYSQYRKVDLDIESIVNCMIWIEDNVIDFRTNDGQIRRMKFSEKSLKKLLLVISTYLSRDD